MAVETVEAPIFRDSEADLRHRAKWWTGRVVLYGALVLVGRDLPVPDLLDVTTAFKLQKDLLQGSVVPWLEFAPSWKGFASIGLSPDTIGIDMTRATSS
jgi:multiple sugar transport system permease protein